MFKTILNFSLALCVGIFLSACKEDYVQPKLIESTDEHDKYMVHYEYKTEQWNDPEILSTPRLQFTWEAPDAKHEAGKNLSTIWSMRLDGTDLREVASLELLDTPRRGGKIGAVQYERSQNNRYLAFNANSNLGGERRIIDLETKTVKVIEISYGDPDFNWFGDSRYLLFGGREGLMQYDLQTEELTYMGDKFEGVKRITAYHPYDNGNKIIVRDSKGFVGLYDFATKKLLKELNGSADKMAADSQFWLEKGSVGFESQLYVANLENAKKPVKILPYDVKFGYPVSVKGRVYTNGGYGVIWAKPGDKKVTYFVLPGKRYTQNLSINNAYAEFNE